MQSSEQQTPERQFSEPRCPECGGSVGTLIAPGFYRCTGERTAYTVDLVSGCPVAFEVPCTREYPAAVAPSIPDAADYGSAENPSRLTTALAVCAITALVLVAVVLSGGWTG